MAACVDVGGVAMQHGGAWPAWGGMASMGRHGRRPRDLAESHLGHQPVGGALVEQADAHQRGDLDDGGHLRMGHVHVACGMCMWHAHGACAWGAYAWGAYAWGVEV